LPEQSVVVQLNESLGVPGFFPLNPKAFPEEDVLSEVTIRHGSKDTVEHNEYGSMHQHCAHHHQDKERARADVREQLNRLVHLQEVKKEITV
jgi:hypothetical protein